MNSSRPLDGPRGQAKDTVDKGDVLHNEYVRDHDILGEGVDREQAMHMGVLTEEELEIEKKLLKKIDYLIMPLVVLVYLMNYVDR